MFRVHVYCLQLSCRLKTSDTIIIKRSFVRVNKLVRVFILLHGWWSEVVLPACAPCVPPGLVSPDCMAGCRGAPPPPLHSQPVRVRASELRAVSGVSSLSSRARASAAAACVREREVRGDTGGGWSAGPILYLMTPASLSSAVSLT